MVQTRAHIICGSAKVLKMASSSTDEISSSQEKNSDSADSQEVPGLVEIDGAIGIKQIIGEQTLEMTSYHGKSITR